MNNPRDYNDRTRGERVYGFTGKPEIRIGYEGKNDCHWFKNIISKESNGKYIINISYKGKEDVIKKLKKEVIQFGFVDMDADFGSKQITNVEAIDSSKYATLIGPYIDQIKAEKFLNLIFKTCNSGYPSIHLQKKMREGIDDYRLDTYSSLPKYLTDVMKTATKIRLFCSWIYGQPGPNLKREDLTKKLYETTIKSNPNKRIPTDDSLLGKNYSKWLDFININGEHLESCGINDHDFVDVMLLWSTSYLKELTNTVNIELGKMEKTIQGRVNQFRLEFDMLPDNMKLKLDDWGILKTHQRPLTHQFQGF